MTSLWNNFNFCDYTMKTHYLENTMNLFSFSWFTMNLFYFCKIIIYFLFILRIHCEFTLNFLILLWTHYLFYKYESIFSIFFANILWFHVLFRVILMNLLCISRIHHEYTIFFVNILWIHYRFRGLNMSFREFTSNILSLFANCWANCFVNWLLNNYLFRE